MYLLLSTNEEKNNTSKLTCPESIKKIPNPAFAMIFAG